MDGEHISEASGTNRRPEETAVVPTRESGNISRSNTNQDMRVVLGPVPSLEEARAATSDLRDALETIQSRNFPRGQAGLQALQLMQHPEIQHVIGSAASNRGVFDDVMQVEAVQLFFRTNMAVGSVHFGASWERLDQAPFMETGGFISWLVQAVQSLAKMLRKCSEFLESISVALGEGFNFDSGSNNDTEAARLPLSLSIILLVITTILIVFLRRQH